MAFVGIHDLKTHGRFSTIERRHISSTNLRDLVQYTITTFGTGHVANAGRVGSWRSDGSWEYAQTRQTDVM
eukprot:scaffold170016_cov36-Prasinocladus_malaysianus.AAC.1